MLAISDIKPLLRPHCNFSQFYRSCCLYLTDGYETVPLNKISQFNAVQCLYLSFNPHTLLFVLKNHLLACLGLPLISRQEPV